MLFIAVKTATLGGLTPSKNDNELHMDLFNIISPQAVRAVNGIASKKRLFRELGSQVHQHYGVDPEDAVDALLARESLGPTGVGRGVALPHARLPGLDGIIGCFLRLDRPLDFDSVDRQPVDLVFGLFAPENSGAHHLKALATVSRTMRDPGVCDKLRNNADPATLFAILIEGPAAIAA